MSSSYHPVFGYSAPSFAEMASRSVPAASSTLSPPRPIQADVQPKKKKKLVLSMMETLNQPIPFVLFDDQWFWTEFDFIDEFDTLNVAVEHAKQKLKLKYFHVFDQQNGTIHNYSRNKSGGWELTELPLRLLSKSKMNEWIAKARRTASNLIVFVECDGTRPWKSNSPAFSKPSSLHWNCYLSSSISMKLTPKMECESAGTSSQQ